MSKSYTKKENTLRVEYVKSDRDALNSPGYLNDKKFIEALGSKFIKGFTVITTNDKKYVRYEDGVEEIYSLNDEDTNIIDTVDTRSKFNDI